MEFLSNEARVVLYEVRPIRLYVMKTLISLPNMKALIKRQALANFFSIKSDIGAFSKL
jgi:hypothetical protein